MLVSRTFEKSQHEPTFQTVKVTPTKVYAGAVKMSEPFIAQTQPADRLQPVDQHHPVVQPQPVN